MREGKGKVHIAFEIPVGGQSQGSQITEEIEAGFAGGFFDSLTDLIRQCTKIF